LKEANKNLRILVIAHNQIYTGPYHKILELCQALANQGNQVTLLCTSHNNKEGFKNYQFNGIEIVESPDLLKGRLRQGVDPWNALQRIRYLRHQHYDIIHAIDSRPVVILPALWLKRKLDIPLILSWWDWYGRGGTAVERSGKCYAKTFGIFETFFEEFFRKYADRATVITTALKNRLEKLKYPSDKIEIHRVGCNARQTKIINRKLALAQLGLENSRPIFCFLGTLFDNDKDLLLDALRIVKSEHSTMPHTILIGNHKIDSQTREQLSIQTTGYLESLDLVYQFLFAADYALLPMKINVANIARWPSKITEYWTAGLPVVATPVSDFEQIFTDYKVGILSKNDSVASYAEALNCAIDLPESERRKLSDSGRKYAKTELDWEILARRLIQLYIKTIHSSG